MASKLDRHLKVIFELREQKKTYDYIADYLLNEHDLKVWPSTIYSFVKRRTKKELTLYGSRAKIYLAELTEDIKYLSYRVIECNEYIKQNDKRRKEFLEDYHHMKENISECIKKLEEITDGGKRINKNTGWLRGTNLRKVNRFRRAGKYGLGNSFIRYI